LTQGFPFLPPGCRLVLDRVASERVLANLRQCLPSRRPQLLEELRALAAEGVLTPTSDLAEWLEALAMDPADFYGIRGASFTALRHELGWLGDAPYPEEERLSRAIGSALLHGDDPDRLRALAAALSAPAPPELQTLGERERRAWLMLTVQLFGTGRQWRPLDDALAVLWQAGAWRQELRQLLELLAARADHRLHPLSWALPVPLRVHGHYSRAEIEAAFGVLSDHAPWIHREGVRWHQPSQCDLLFVREQRKQGGRGVESLSRSCAWGSRVMRAMRASGSGLSQSGDPLAAGAGDPGGVDARLLCGTPAVAWHSGGLGGLKGGARLETKPPRRP